MTLNLRKLISISTQLSFEACRVINESLVNKSYKSYLKGKDDHVTDTDYKIQSMLVRGFNLHFPRLSIVGEENQEFEGTIDYNYHQLIDDMLPQQSSIDQQIDIAEACLWIDPIDCTLGFVTGNYEDVTVLIGLAYKQKPLVGIIGTPYKLVGDKKVFDPVVTIGSVKQRQAFDFTGKGWVKKAQKYPINDPLKIATSNSRISDSEISLVRTLRAQHVKAGGSGRKIMMVANGQVDAMAYCQSWTHKWDSCAGDALIRSMGGRFTTPFGQSILYDHTLTQTKNRQGMITSLDRQVYEKCLDALGVF